VLDRSQIFLLLAAVACHRLGLRTMVYADDLLIVGSSDAAASPAPFLRDATPSMGVQAGSRSPAALPLSSLPAALAVPLRRPPAPPVPPRTSRVGVTPLASSLRALRQHVNLQRRALRAAERSLARLESVALATVAQHSATMPQRLQPDNPLDESWKWGWDPPDEQFRHRGHL
jgi:hypothetical protein